MVIEIFSKAEFVQVLKDKDNTQVVVDFWASWSSSCKKIGPIFEEMEFEFVNVKFVKVGCNTLLHV